MKERTKKILNFALIFGTLAIVLLIGASDQDIGGAIAALRRIDIKWILLSIAAFFGFLACDALSIWYCLRRQGYHYSLLYSMFVSITGQYYSNITPGASGGQPMQVYYLHKKNIPVGTATSALVVRFFSFQFMLSVIATILWIAHGAYVAEHIGDKMWILIVGYVYNGVMVSFVLLLAVNKAVVGFLMEKIIRLGAGLHLIRSPESVKTKWFEVLDNFNSGILMLGRRPLDIMIQLLLGGAQLMSLMTIIYFVYRGLGLQGASYGELVAVDVMEYVSAAYAPLPGASGAQEGVFSWYFGRIFEGELTLAALLLWRFFTYYLSLIVGAIVTVTYGLVTGTKPSDISSDPDSLKQ